MSRYRNFNGEWRSDDCHDWKPWTWAHPAQGMFLFGLALIVAVIVLAMIIGVIV